MPALRRSLVVAAAVILALLPVFSASASTADDLEAAKQRLATAPHRGKRRESRVARRRGATCRRHRITSRRSSQTISDLKEKAAALHDIVRKRALYAYTHAGNDIDVAVGTDDPLAATRGQALIDQANEKDNTTVKRLAAINSDLHDQTVAFPTRRASNARSRISSTRATRSSRPRSTKRRRQPPRSRRSTTRRSPRRKGGAQGRAPKGARRARRSPARDAGSGVEPRRRPDRGQPESQPEPDPRRRVVHVPGVRRGILRRLRRSEWPSRERPLRRDRHPGLRSEGGHRALRPQRGGGGQYRLLACGRRQFVLLRAPVPVRGRRGARWRRAK